MLGIEFLLCGILVIILIENLLVKYYFSRIVNWIIYAIEMVLFISCVAVIGWLTLAAEDEDSGKFSLGSGYYFIDKADIDIKYSSCDIKGFTYDGYIGYIEKDNTYSTAPEKLFFVVEYTDEYILAKGSDGNYTIILKKDDMFFDSLNVVQFDSICSAYKIIPLWIKQVGKQSAFAF